MICKFQHDGMCCNCGSLHYQRICKERSCPHIISISNADHIRSMTDEELAEWMEHYNVDCRICSEYQRCKGDVVFHYAPCDMECAQHYLNWLKQPYKEDT